MNLEKESKSLEFKEKLTDTFLKTVCAFANYGTGTIKFGINNDGKIIGIDDMSQCRLDIENKINDSIDPIPDYSFEEDIKNKVLSLIVKEGFNKPYFYKSKTYMRKDTSTIEADRVSLTRLILEGNSMYYDMLKSREQDLSFKILEDKLKEKIKIDSFDINTLKTLELYSDTDGYNIAAELLADKNKNYGIDIVRFGENINIILDRITIDHVSIIEQYYKALEMFRHYYIYEEIEGAERVKKEKIPEKAYREAIANALVHRAWDDNANINVSFYDDRIEILSPGGLPKGMTEKEYLEDKLSKTRNPIIANIFFRLNLIERMGTGVQRINAEYNSSANKPKYKVSENLIVVTLPINTAKNVVGNVVENNKDVVGNVVENDNSVVENGTVKLVFIEISKNKFVSANDIAKILNKNQRTIQRAISFLKESNRIKRVGPDKGGYWEIINK